MQIAVHDQVQAIVHEAYILHLVQHPNVIGMKETLIKEGQLVLVMEHAEYGDLETFCEESATLRPAVLGQRLAMHVLFQMSLALEYMHRNLIAHRDIKPANIVLASDGMFKVRHGCKPR